MRVAAIYDVHGNLQALEAALAEIEQARPDLTVVGGDLVWGPLPRETLDRLMAVEGARFVRGDADRDVFDREGEVAEWVADQLTAGHLEFLMAQPETLSLEIDGLGPTLFCHGSPRSDRDRITVGSVEEKVLAWLEGVEEGVVVCGHTHAQFDRYFGRHRVVNPGGFGLQFGPRGAAWALLGPDVEMRLAAYDVEAAAARFRSTDCPVAELFAERVVDPPPAGTAVVRWG